MKWFDFLIPILITAFAWLAITLAFTLGREQETENPNPQETIQVEKK